MGFFDSYYYGKAGKADYTVEQMPTNRFQLFFDMLRIRFTGIMGMNFFFLLASLPAILWTILNVAMINETLAPLVPGEQLAAEQFAGISQGVLGYITMYLYLMIPCLMLIAVIQTGVIYVLRNWARDQHSFVMSDFRDAIKANWKQALLVGFINGASLILLYISYQYYGELASANSVIWVVPQVLVVVVCALWWMANMLIFPMMVTYDMKFTQLVRNGFIMTLARLPWAVLIGFFTLAIPVVLLFVAPPYGMLADVVIYLLIGFGLTLFVHVSFANSTFDRYLNPRIEGAPVNQGLRDPSLDEDEDKDE